MNRLIKILFFFLISVFVLTDTSSCNDFKPGFGSVKGDAVSIKKVRTVQPFNSIKANAGMDVILIQGDAQKVEIEGEDNLIDLITTEVKDSILNIFPNKPFNSTKPLRVIVTFIELKRISALSGTTINAENKIRCNELEINLSGGSNLKGDFTINKFKCSIKGGSYGIFTGEVESIDLRINSGSNFKGKEMKIKNCKALVSSGSNVHINVSENINASATSGSKIIISGNPKQKNLNSSVGSEIVMSEKE